MALPTERAQSASTRKRKATSAGEDEPKEKSRKRSHHAKRMCPVCKKEDANLKRHLMSHARKGHIKAESVASILSIAINKGKRRGPARSTSTGKQEQKGLKLKWCPVKDCQKVTHLLRSHLSKFHNIKAGFLMERYLFMAREYKGKAEVKQMKKEMREGRRKHREQPTKPSVTITSSTLDEETAPMEITAGPSTSQAEEPEPTPSPSPILIPADVPSEEEDGEEDESHYPDRKAFFKDPNPRSNRHRWLVLFYHHLNKPDCGRKKQKNRLQHAEHVRRILEDLQPRGSDIDIL